MGIGIITAATSGEIDPAVVAEAIGPKTRAAIEAFKDHPDAWMYILGVWEEAFEDGYDTGVGADTTKPVVDLTGFKATPARRLRAVQLSTNNPPPGPAWGLFSCVRTSLDGLSWTCWPRVTALASGGSEISSRRQFVRTFEVQTAEHGPVVTILADYFTFDEKRGVHFFVREEASPYDPFVVPTLVYRPGPLDNDRAFVEREVGFVAFPRYVVEKDEITLAPVQAYVGVIEKIAQPQKLDDVGPRWEPTADPRV